MLRRKQQGVGVQLDMLHEVRADGGHDVRRDVNITAGCVGLGCAYAEFASDSHDGPPDADNARVDVDIIPAKLGQFAESHCTP